MLGFIKSTLIKAGKIFETTTAKVVKEKGGGGNWVTKKDFIPVHKLMDKVHQAGARLVMLGSAAVICAFVADGKLSMYFQKGLKSWDIAAAILLIEEAGGIVKNIEGKLDIFHPQTFVCGNKKIVNEFLNLV